MELRKRPKISITLDPESIKQLDLIAERLGENRSRLMEQFVLDGVKQHQFCPAKGSGEKLPDVFEIFRRVVVYKDRYEIAELGCRSCTYEMKWIDLPEELKPMFPQNIEFNKWLGTRVMLQSDRAELEARIEEIKLRLAQLDESESGKKRKGR